MNITFLLGPAGTGKTYQCLQEIREELKRSAVGLPLVFLAPKQATYQLERQLLGDPDLDGFTRLKIVGFETLAQFTLQELATPPRLLSEQGRVMVLRALIEQHCPKLEFFRASARTAGFAQQLSSMLSELQRHQLSPELIAADADVRGPELKAKLADLALLWRLYLEWLAREKLHDPDTLLALAAEAVLEARARGVFQLGGLWLDGFAELSRQELTFLEALASCSHRATLAFCVDTATVPDEWHSMWNIPSRAVRDCKQHLSKIHGAQFSDRILQRHGKRSRFAECGVLADLEAAWTRGEPPPGTQEAQLVLRLDSNAAKPVRVFQCATPEAEATIAAREILKFVQAGGRFREIAVIVRSLDDYDHVVSRVFNRYGIPFFLDCRQAVSHHPLAELTRYALRLAAGGWQHEDWFGALKTGLVHADDSLIDRLENEARAHGWTGDAWLNPLPDRSKDLERVRLELVTPFQQFAETVTRKSSAPMGQELAQSIRRLWEDLGVEQTIQSWSADGVHAAAWTTFQEWLSNVELAFAKLPIPLATWMQIVEAGLAELTVGVIPPSLDQVLIGAVDRSRNPDLKLVLVLGLNETVFPAKPAEPAIVSEYERASLNAAGLRFGRSQREQLGLEQFFGYIACTRAREKLMLTYAERDFEGNPLNPSGFLEHLRHILPNIEPETVSAAFDWRESVHWRELVPPILRNRNRRENPQLTSLEKLPPFTRWGETPSSPGRGNLIPDLVEALYGPELTVSLSAMEDFAACPFRFFVKQGLRVAEREEFEADRRVRGSFQHEVLMHFHRRLQSQGRRWRDVSPEEAKALMAEIGVEIQGTFQDGLLMSTPQRRFTAQSLIENVQRLVAVLVEFAPQYEFQPAAVEIAFGQTKEIPGWRINLGDGRFLVLNGRIDRVDLDVNNGEASAVVIDYKARGQKLEELKLRHGIDLQLFAYLGVLQNTEGLEQIFGVPKLSPAGAFYLSVEGHRSSAKNRNEALENCPTARKFAYQHEGRFRQDLLLRFDNTGKPKGDQFKFSLNKGGGFSVRGNDALGADEFLALVSQTEDFLRKFGRAIYSGDVTVAPYRVKRETACSRCEYQSICRFDPWTEPYRVLREIRAQQEPRPTAEVPDESDDEDETEP